MHASFEKCTKIIWIIEINNWSLKTYYYFVLLTPWWSITYKWIVSLNWKVSFLSLGEEMLWRLFISTLDSIKCLLSTAINLHSVIIWYLIYCKVSTKLGMSWIKVALKSVLKEPQGECSPRNCKLHPLFFFFYDNSVSLKWKTVNI